MSDFGNAYALKPAIMHRTEVRGDGTTRRWKRPACNALPGMPRTGQEFIAFLYSCPITKDYVVAARADHRVIGKYRYVCYHAAPNKKVAIMYVLMVGGR